MTDDSSPRGHAGPVRHVDLDAGQVTALAHPIRARLLTALRLHGPATATTLATRLGTTSGTTSYHLRKLATVGLVADAPEQGDGRDRWWRAAQEAHSYEAARFADDPDARAAADWLASHYLRLNARRAEDWLEQRDEWPSAWRAAADLSDWMLHLTAEDLQALVDELHEVVRRWRDRAEHADPGVERVLVQMQGFPVRHDQPDDLT